MERVVTALTGVLELGGPVVMGLGAIAILTLTVILYKLWQFAASGVGRHKAIQDALRALDQGDLDRGHAELARSQSYLAPVIAQAMAQRETPHVRDRLEAEIETKFAHLDGGLRLLDVVAQLAPLLGLFGTVLGMIEAFQALQEAGSSVDPSLLAGGIWVALLTTAVGLAVAMPASVVLSWFDARMTQERVFADLAIGTVLTPLSGAHDTQQTHVA